nr:MAG TPA: hypothetical protein [Caudoviricetes sp.]
MRNILESSSASDLATDRIHFPLLDLRDRTVLSLYRCDLYKLLIPTCSIYHDLRSSIQHHIVGCVIVQRSSSSFIVELLCSDSHISSRDLYSESASRQRLDPLISVVIEVIDCIIQPLNDLFWNIH